MLPVPSSRLALRLFRGSVKLDHLLPSKKNACRPYLRMYVLKYNSKVRGMPYCHNSLPHVFPLALLSCLSVSPSRHLAISPSPSCQSLHSSTGLSFAPFSPRLALNRKTRLLRLAVTALSSL